MYILGISCYYHDSSATLLKDGVVISAAEEERFTRKKHDNSFPINAINYCLKNENITIENIDYVSFYEKPLLKFERVIFQHLEMFPLSLQLFLESMPSWINQKLCLLREIRRTLKYKKDVIFVNHHLSHAGSAFFSSSFKKAAILTIDGVGEWTTTAFGLGEGTKINLMKEIKFPHSLGILYSTITAYLGFTVNNSEYKIMGLAAYGDMNAKTNVYYSKLKKVIDIKKDGSYRLDMRYFVFHYKNKMPSKKLCSLLGGIISKKNSLMTQRHKDIAAAVQLIVEEVLTNILNFVYSKTTCTNLVLAGGVALNSVYNGKILSNTPFKNVWIQPNASDGGTSMGAALYLYNFILKKERKYVFENPYLGPSFSNKEVKQFLDENKITYSTFRNHSELVQITSKLLFDNNVVGWFQGRSEWGPRALGARSILANPCNPDAQNLLNTKVKHREKFRPFAPVVCEDDAFKYFSCDKPLPKPTDYMLMVYPVLNKWREQIPSVTHVDGSARLQIIRREQNQLYYDLIKEFGKLSKLNILINTSFNIRGEPIVNSPYDAYKCFMGTGMDYLVINNFLLKKEDNLKDEWNSEIYARD